jgi:hypothetical protein
MDTMHNSYNSTINNSKSDISAICSKRWPYKLKTRSLRTQVLANINNNMVINISNSELCGVRCKFRWRHGMFLNMKVYNKINIRDIVVVDGGYILFIKQFEKLCNKKDKKLNGRNFSIL